MSSNKKKGVPDKDPYDVLGIDFGASETEISKAYRKLARNLHPDKLVAQNLSPSEIAQASVKFQEIQTARSFLIDPEHASDKVKYDAKRASDRLRQATEEARLKSMSDKRKRMREELQNAEEVHTKHQKGHVSRRRQQKSDADKKEELARQGRELREKYAAKAAEEKETELQNLQIRLKWSRKRLKNTGEESPSEDSIAKMLKSFGQVTSVRMIGSKGNVALVTFPDESSCTQTVQHFATSEAWRATYVSKAKRDEEEAKPPPSVQNNERDREDLADWKLRHQEERERLIRQMGDQPQETSNEENSRPFPPPFPKEYDSLASPIDRLERAEQDLLKGLLSEDTLQRMKIGQA